LTHDAACDENRLIVDHTKVYVGL